MSVDKFGRHLNFGQGLRGPKGEGFELTADGNFNIQNKKLCNVGNATDTYDCVNLNTLQSSVKEINERLDKSIEEVKNNALTKNIKKEFNADGGIIINLSKPHYLYDAINYKYFIDIIIEVTYAIYQQLHKKKKKKTKKEWKDFVFNNHAKGILDWSELFSVKEEPRDKTHPNTDV